MKRQPPGPESLGRLRRCCKEWLFLPREKYLVSFLCFAAPVIGADTQLPPSIFGSDSHQFCMYCGLIMVDPSPSRGPRMWTQRKLTILNEGMEGCWGFSPTLNYRWTWFKATPAGGRDVPAGAPTPLHLPAATPIASGTCCFHEQIQVPLTRDEHQACQHH